jgi:4'-phosphopantetheinyl transferase
MTASHRCDIYLAGTASLEPAHVAVLDAAERARAASYLRQADRDRFALGAVLLRAAAGRRLGWPPGRIAVDRNCDQCGRQHGRPRLAQAPGLHVSVTHSGTIVAVALTCAGAVGVDVEAVGEPGTGPPIATGLLIDAVCTPAERREVHSAADFYAYWTRKEAVLKATGEGLRRPMIDVHVSPPGAAPRLLALAGQPAPCQPAPCQLTDLDAAPGYRAAAAVLTAAPVEFAVADAGSMLAALAAAG